MIIILLGKNSKLKKRDKKDTYTSKKKKNTGDEDEGDVESDEEEELDNVESKEFDYMSESSSGNFKCFYQIFQYASIELHVSRSIHMKLNNYQSTLFCCPNLWCTNEPLLTDK